MNIGETDYKKRGMGLLSMTDAMDNAMQHDALNSVPWQTVEPDPR
jgi:hypothetical protein